MACVIIYREHSVPANNMQFASLFDFAIEVGEASCEDETDRRHVDRLKQRAVGASVLGRTAVTDERLNFRGALVTPDWPERIRAAQEILTCRVGGLELSRVRFGSEREDWGADDGPCRDCAVIKGELHVPTCDVERCPRCGGQLWFGCECTETDPDSEGS